MTGSVHELVCMGLACFGPGLDVKLGPFNILVGLELSGRKAEAQLNLAPTCCACSLGTNMPKYVIESPALPN